MITGAAGGIGGAIAALAVGAGQAVAMVDSDEQRLTTAARSLDGPVGSGPLPITCDVADEGAVEAAFELAAGRLGPPRRVVAAAGIDRAALLHRLDASDWDDVIAVNLRGTFLTCRAAIRGMLAQGEGSIVCVASPLALVATPGGSGAYSASKAGICALVRSLALDYAPHGVRVNALLPGPTETDLMWANVPDAEIAGTREKVSGEVPLGRLADPREVARTALWLLSHDASYITGVQLPCDGGVLAKASVSV